ncbi:MAG: 2-oxo acid dehydrogenase subunit E2 [Pseudomonadota bacterium]
MTVMVDVKAPAEQEGTQAIVKTWFKAVGENVAEGDPLVELETDRVAVEVAAPAGGVLREILVSAEAEAPPGAVLGRIDEAGEARATDGAASAVATPQTIPSTTGPAPAPGGRADPVDPEHRLSPAVRRLVVEHDLDPAAIVGTGKNGRLTRDDVMRFLEATPPAAFAKGPQPAEPSLADVPAPGAPDAPAGRLVPHTSMRRRIADHMAQSVATAPHVTAVFEADFTAIAAHRAKHKAAFAAQGVNLTYTAYLVAASVAAMAAAPTVNSRWREDALEVFDDVNIGVGTALGDAGLIVPVIRSAQTLSHFGVAQALHALTEKARTGALAPADVRGGTFSISNHGVSGSLVASPIIINQPQSAILGVGKLEKRAVVRTVDGVDSLQIRPMAYVSLTIDHRVLDGAQTNAWLTRFVETLETWPFE